VPAVTLQDDVIAALIALWTPAVDPIPVDDGYLASSESVHERVLVGGDATGDPGDVTTAAQSTQTPATFESDPADEDGLIQCAVWADSGDDVPTALASRRAATRAAMVLLEAALRDDPTLGGLVGTSWIETITTLQTRVTGTTVIRQFTVRYQGLQDAP
jgi:hypothetical protein